MIEKTLDRLMIEEGFSSKPYKDTVGKLTIGFGRNLDDVGLTLEESRFLLKNDVDKTVKLLREKFDWFNDLSAPRQSVIIDMVFNMGYTRFIGFKKMIQFIIQNDYNNAASEMLNSKWATQVKGRAVNLSKMMRSGEYL